MAHAVVMSRTDTPSPAPPTPVLALIEDLAELWVVHVFANVVDADVSICVEKGRSLAVHFESLGMWSSYHTFVDYQVWGICALVRGRTDRCIRATRGLGHALSFRSSS